MDAKYHFKKPSLTSQDVSINFSDKAFAPLLVTSQNTSHRTCMWSKHWQMENNPSSPILFKLRFNLSIYLTNIFS